MRLLFSLPLLLLLHLGLAIKYDERNDDWRLVRNENNIKVYAADSDFSSYKKIRVVATVQGKWEKIIPTFQNIAGYSDWIYATEQAYLIKRISKTEVLYYLETGLPWPAKNRDAAVMMRIADAGDSLVIYTEGQPNIIPPTDGKVRVPWFKGRWIFKTAGEEKIDILYEFDLDPGGSLPTWIVNMFIDKGPYETILKLSEILKE